MSKYGVWFPAGNTGVGVDVHRAELFTVWLELAIIFSSHNFHVLF